MCSLFRDYDFSHEGNTGSRDIVHPEAFDTTNKSEQLPRIAATLRRTG